MNAEYDGLWKLTKFHREATLLAPDLYIYIYIYIYIYVELSHTSVVRLHALEGKRVESPTFQVKCLLLGRNSALDSAAGPERMPHRAPGIGRIGAKVRRPVLANDQAGRYLRKGQINQAVLINRRLDRVTGAVLVQRQRKVVCAKRVHLLVKHVVLQRVRVPEVRRIAGERVDLGVELAGCVEATIPLAGFPLCQTRFLTQHCCR
jgi:hypothetical protein